MSEVSYDIKQFNKQWDVCKREKRPLIILKKGSKKATLYYDMWTINYNLKPNAVNAIHTLFDKILKESTTLKSCLVWGGKGNGSIGKIPLDVGRRFLPPLAAIIENKENWDNSDFLFGLGEKNGVK